MNDFNPIKRPKPYDPLDAKLALFHQLDRKLHRLRNTWPTGMREHDDEVSRQITKLTQDIQELNKVITKLRKA